MIWCDGYLPVPMSSREVNSRPAINKVSMIDSRLPDSPADEVHDFDLIPFADSRVRVAVTLEDDEIVLDGDTARIDLQREEQLGDGRGVVERERISVQGDRGRHRAPPLERRVHPKWLEQRPQLTIAVVAKVRGCVFAPGDRRIGRT